MTTGLSRALVIDDHPLFRDAIATAITQVCPEAECQAVASIDEALEVLDTQAEFDLALLDLKLPGVQGFDGLLRLRTIHPRLPILIVSGLDNEAIVRQAIDYGAAGFLSKSLGHDRLRQAIETVAQGDIYVSDDLKEERSQDEDQLKRQTLERLMSLTPAQARVLMMLREGMLNKQIAYELDVSGTTVKKHVSEILRKLNVYSRTQAVIEVSRLNQTELFDLERQFKD